MTAVPLKLMVCDYEGSCVLVKGHGLMVEGSVVEIREEDAYDLIEQIEEAIDEIEEG